MACHSRPAALGEEPEPVLESIEHIGRGQDAQPGGGHLQRQGEPVETPADLGDRRHIGVAEIVKPANPAGPIDEEPNGVSGQELGPGQSLVGGHRQGRQAYERLIGQAQRLTTGGQDPETRSRAEEALDQPCAVVDQVLAVVEDHEQRTRADLGHHGVEQAGVALLGGAD